MSKDDAIRAVIENWARAVSAGDRAAIQGTTMPQPIPYSMVIARKPCVFTSARWAVNWKR